MNPKQSRYTLRARRSSFLGGNPVLQTPAGHRRLSCQSGHGLTTKAAITFTGPCGSPQQALQTLGRGSVTFRACHFAATGPIGFQRRLGRTGERASAKHACQWSQDKCPAAPEEGRQQRRDTAGLHHFTQGRSAADRRAHTAKAASCNSRPCIHFGHSPSSYGACFGSKIPRVRVPHGRPSSRESRATRCNGPEDVRYNRKREFDPHTVHTKVSQPCAGAASRGVMQIALDESFDANRGPI